MDNSYISATSCSKLVIFFQTTPSLEVSNQIALRRDRIEKEIECGLAVGLMAAENEKNDE